MKRVAHKTTKSFLIMIFSGRKNRAGAPDHNRKAASHEISMRKQGKAKPQPGLQSPRRCQQRLAGGDLVAVDLFDQRLDTVEMRLGPQPFDQADAQHLAVDIFREVEPMLEAHLFDFSED